MPVCLAAALAEPPDGDARQEPWSDAAAQLPPFPAWRDVCYDDFAQGPPTQESLLRWLTPLDPQSGLLPANTRYGAGWRMQGRLRWRAPWLENSSILFSMERLEGLHIHVFHGQDGVTLESHHAEGRQWSAYATRRDPEQTRPLQLRLAATDQQRASRCELRHGGALALHYRQGHVLLTRGDQVLVSAPLSGTPQALVWEGPAAICGLAIVRSSDGPSPEADRWAALSWTPAQLQWSNHAPSSAAWEARPEGGRLRMRQSSAAGWVTAETPHWAPRLVTLRLTTMTAGAALYWIDDQPPSILLRCGLDARLGELSLFTHWADETVERRAELSQPVATLGGGAWVRFVQGGAFWRWWISQDGVHWTQAEPAREMRAPHFRTLGIHAVGGKQAECEVQQLRVAPLPTLTGLADPTLAPRAPDLSDASDFAQWRRLAQAAQPADVSLDSWMRSTAIATLGQGCNRILCHALLRALLADSTAATLPWSRQRDLLDEAFLLWGVPENAAEASWIAARYQEWAAAAPEREPGSFLLGRDAVFRSPIDGPLGETEGRDLLLDDLLRQGYARRWSDVLQLYHAATMQRQDLVNPLVIWIADQARRQLGQPPLPTPLETYASNVPGWDSYLRPETDRDAYSLLASWRSLAAAGEWDLVSDELVKIWPASAATAAVQGGEDPAHVVSLRQAIGSLLQQRPLSDRHHERQGALAALRISAAIEAGDAAALQWGVELFPRSSAAATARLWLADDALSRGAFRQACHWYRQYEVQSPDSADETWKDRRRLAQSRLAQDAGQLPSAPPLPEAERPPAPVAKPLLAGPELFAEQVGRLPAQEVDQGVNRWGVDWVGRQIGYQVTDGELFINNHFQVARWKLGPQPALIWRSAPLTERAIQARQWGLQSMTVQVDEGYVLARLLSDHLPVVACWSQQDGDLLWTLPLENEIVPVSDPLRLDERWGLLAIRRQGEQSHQLVWLMLDVRVGCVIAERPIAAVGVDWIQRHCVTTSVYENGVLATVDGSVLHLDLQGQLRWSQRQWTLPPAADPFWPAQSMQPPVVADQVVIVAQPGVRMIEAFSLRDGQRVWGREHAQLRRLLGVRGSVVLAQEGEHLVALDLRDGGLLWSHPSSGQWLEAVACDDRFVFATEVDKAAPQFISGVWLSLRGGAIAARRRLPAAAAPLSDLRAGPLVGDAGRFWLMVGQGPSSTARFLTPLHWLPAPAEPPQPASPWDVR